MLLRDLTFIEDGNSFWHDEANKIVNIEKVVLLGKVIARLQFLQNVPYELGTLEPFTKFLQRTEIKNMKELQALSLQLEPRES